MKELNQTENKNQKKRKCVNVTPATEERLKVIASIIVERIVEDQRNGLLRFKMKKV